MGDSFHTGEGSGRIGKLYLTDQDLNISNTSDSSYFPQIVQTSDGVLHAVWADATPISGNQTTASDIFYSYKSPGESWSSPIIVAPIHQYNATYTDLIVDSNGTIHLVWLNLLYGGADVSYASKPLGGVWSQGQVIANQISFGSYYAPAIALDSLNGAHVTWSDGIGTHYAYKPAGGSWSTPISIGNFGEIPHGIAVDTNDYIYVFYVFEETLYEISKPLGGDWSPPEIVFSNVETFLIEANPSGGLLAFWNDQTTLYFASSDADGNWSAPIIVSSQGTPVVLKALTVADNGNIHLSWMETENNEYKAYYRSRFLDESWSASVPLTNNFDNTSAIDFLAESDGSLHVIWSGAFDIVNFSEIYYEKVNWAQNGWGSLFQSVTLTPEMNKPTLSFSYLLDIPFPDNGDSALEVFINQNNVFSTTTETADWTHAWIDLSPWVSQTITITFQTTNDVFEGLVNTYLDDITISSWLTPVPTAVDLTHIPLPSGPVQITITGENFIATPTVKLGDISLENVQWIDEHTLQATVPANLPPGRYNLWVTNPGGQTSVLASAIIVGNEIFLPLIAR